jgi:membrane-bound serine protease (ClpP class)
MLPGVVGAISLMLALFALQVLPVNYAGLGLIILGVIFMIAEAFAPSFGVLGIGGLSAFLFGSIILIDTDMPGYGISLPLIIGFSIASAVFFFSVVGMAIKARQRPVVSGQEELPGAVGIAVQDFDRDGLIQVHGETWNAVTRHPVKQGQRVKVVRLDGLTLTVDPLEEA